MTIKEITALRKAGKYEEALEAAEKEFALNANNYTAGTLFWCLNEIGKNETEQSSMNSIYERMMLLHNEFCPQDEYMPRSLRSLEKRLDPLSNQIRESIERAKTGQVNGELISTLQNAFDSQTLNQSLFADYGWLIYYTLKNTVVNNVQLRKQLLHNYIKLELPRPDLLHSMILSEAVKVEKNTPLQFRIRDFMTIWGWDNLREEDWQQFQSENGHTSSSLVEKLISVYAKELKTDKIASPTEFETLVDKALVRYPNSQYMPFYKATVLMSKGQNRQALDYYKQLILNSPSKCYLWQQASGLVDDNDTRIALLCKAIAVERDEAFKGICRLSLANALIEKGLPANAKHELSIYRDYYLSQGWNLKQEYREIESRIQTSVVAQDNDQLYKEYIPLAEKFIYSSIPSVIAIKVADKQMEEKNRPGRRFTQWTLRTKDGVFYLKKPQKFGLDNRLPNGSIFDIKLNKGKIVWIAKSVHNPLQEDWIKMTEGSIHLRTDRNGRLYAIVDGVYVGHKLLNDVNESQNVSIVAIKQEDGRWSASSLKLV